MKPAASVKAKDVSVFGLFVMTASQAFTSICLDIAYFALWNDTTLFAWGNSLLSIGSDQWETGRQVAENARPFMNEHSFEHFMHGERYLKSPACAYVSSVGCPSPTSLPPVWS